MRLFAATGVRKSVSFSNSHFLLGSLSSLYATNLRRRWSHTSTVRQAPPPEQAWSSDVQDKPGPRGRAQGAGTAFTPQVPAPGSSVPTLSPACCQDTEEPSCIQRTSRLTKRRCFSLPLFLFSTFQFALFTFQSAF